MSDDKASPSHPRPGGASRGLKIALAVSVALNLLVAGLVAGALLGREAGRRDAPALRLMGLEPFVRVLPPEARDDVRRRLEAEGPALLRDRAEIGRGLRQVQRALTAEPFDREAVAQALARSRGAAMALQGRAHAALLASLEEMSPDQRARVAEGLERAMRRMELRSR
jgi:uncharacterized membrane protein